MNLIDNNYEKDINKNNLSNNKTIIPLNIIKSNSCKIFKNDEIKQFGNSLLL